MALEQNHTEHRLGFRWLPLTTAILVMILIIGLAMLWRQRESQTLQEGFAATVWHQGRIIENAIEHQFLAVERMATRWETNQGTPFPAWQTDTRHYEEHYQNFQAIAWVDSSNHTRWIEPLAGNEAVQNVNLALEEKRRHAMEKARRLNESTVTETVELAQAEKGFLFFVPLTVDGRFDGFIVAMFRIEGFLDQIFEEHLAKEFHAALKESAKIIYQTGEPDATLDLHSSSTQIQFYDKEWQLTLTPRELPGRDQSLIFSASVLFATILGIFAAFFVNSIQVLRQQKLMLEANNQNLDKHREHLRKLNELFSVGKPSIDEQLKKLLELGSKELGMKYGVISAIAEDNYLILHSSDTKALPIGQEFDLQDTYCALTVQHPEGVFIDHVAESEYQDLKAYKKFKLESYIGFTMLHGDNIIGTLNFSDPSPRSLPFSVEDQEFVKLMARWTASQLEQKGNHQALTESRKRFQMAVDGARDGIWDWIDVNGDAEWWSPRFYHLLGYSEGEISPTLTNFGMLLHPDDHAHTFQAVNDHFENDVQFNVEYRLRTKNAGYRWFRARAELERDGVGNPQRMIGSITDIHEERLSNTALVDMNRALLQSNKELEQFAYVASHDLQEPLRMVTSFAQLLNKRYEGQLDEKADSYLNHIITGAVRMKGLIDALLSFSRIGRAERNLTYISGNQLIEAARHNLRQTILESEANIVVGAIPTLKADVPLLTQVFQNLIANAIKFRSEEPPLIKIDAEDHKTHWQFSVKDNGIGFDPKFAERIFIVFQRLHLRDAYEGTGIGLAICKKIVERHGGKIWAESSPGSGATFYFTISMQGELLYGSDLASGQLATRLTD